MEIIKGIFSEAFWYIAPMLMTLTVALAGVINGAFKITKGMWPQIVAWVVGALISVAAWALQLIQFGDPVWLGVVMLAVVVGLSSNGIYDIPTIKAFVDKWFNRGKSKQDIKTEKISKALAESGISDIVKSEKKSDVTQAYGKLIVLLSDI